MLFAFGATVRVSLGGGCVDFGEAAGLGDRVPQLDYLAFERRDATRAGWFSARCGHSVCLPQGLLEPLAYAAQWVCQTCIFTGDDEIGRRT